MGAFVYVTISNGMVAVSDKHDIAVRQIRDILGAEADRIVVETSERGEVRRAINVRVCQVEVNR